MTEQEVLDLRMKLTEGFNLEVIEQLIEYYDEQNNYEALLPLYEQVLEVDSTDPKALNNLAVIYVDYYQDYEKAKQLYRKTLEIAPNESHVHFNYGAILEFNDHSYEQAKQEYIKAIELDQTYADAYLNLSWLYLERYNDENNSYIVVQEGLKYVDDSYLFAQKGFIEYAKFIQFENAHQSLDRAIELDSENDIAFTYLGQLYVLEEKYDLAMECFEKALETNKINELLISEYGKLLVLHEQDFEKAIELLTIAVENYPDKVIYRCYLANMYFVIGNLDLARVSLHQAETYTIDSQEALLMLGYLKVMLDDNKEDAILYFEKVIELNPNNINALSMIGFYNLLHNEHIDLALTYFKKIAKLQKDYFIIYFIIAQIYMQYYEDYQKALEYFLKINPKSLSKMDLSQLFLVIGDLYETYLTDNNKALDYYELAYRAQPNDLLLNLINHLYEKDKTIVN